MHLDCRTPNEENKNKKKYERNQDKPEYRLTQKQQTANIPHPHQPYTSVARGNRGTKRVTQGG